MRRFVTKKVFRMIAISLTIMVCLFSASVVAANTYRKNVVYSDNDTSESEAAAVTISQDCDTASAKVAAKEAAEAAKKAADEAKAKIAEAECKAPETTKPAEKPAATTPAAPEKPAETKKPAATTPAATQNRPKQPKSRQRPHRQPPQSRPRLHRHRQPAPILSRQKSARW